MGAGYFAGLRLVSDGGIERNDEEWEASQYEGDETIEDTAWSTRKRKTPGSEEWE
jgi:hypothetical protein